MLKKKLKYTHDTPPYIRTLLNTHDVYYTIITDDKANTKELIFCFKYHQPTIGIHRVKTERNTFKINGLNL